MLRASYDSVISMHTAVRSLGLGVDTNGDAELTEGKGDLAGPGIPCAAPERRRATERVDEGFASA